jgi:hypothetical protein
LEPVEKLGQSYAVELRFIAFNNGEPRLWAHPLHYLDLAEGKQYRRSGEATVEQSGRIGDRSMADRVTLRPAGPQDFAFCQCLYFEGMRWIIDRLQVDK